METANYIKDFNSLYNNSYNSFLIFAYGYVRDRHIAEDFVSESFMAYWENRAYLDVQTNPKVYILSVLKNKCLNYLHHLQVRRRAVDELADHSEWLMSVNINALEACSPDLIFSKEIQQIVDNTIDKMPEKTRLVFILSRNQNLTNKEIAFHMNLNVKSVEYHISKALSTLRISLKDFISVIPFLFFLC